MSVNISNRSTHHSDAGLYKAQVNLGIAGYREKAIGCYATVTNNRDGNGLPTAIRHPWCNYRNQEKNNLPPDSLRNIWCSHPQATTINNNNNLFSLILSMPILNTMNFFYTYDLAWARNGLSSNDYINGNYLDKFNLIPKNYDFRAHFDQSQKRIYCPLNKQFNNNPWRF